MIQVATSDVRALSRLVTHYNYGEVLPKIDVNGSTALHFAARKGDAVTLAKLLGYPEIQMSGTVNALEKRVIGGYSPLHHACSVGSVECTRLLLEAGADPSIPADSNLGDTPLHICCKVPDRIHCAELLMEYGADANARDAFGHNPSFWAFSKQNDEIIRRLDLPAVRAATADDYLQLMIKRNGAFSLPAIKAKKSKSSSKTKGKKKK